MLANRQLAVLGMDRKQWRLKGQETPDTTQSYRRIPTLCVPRKGWCRWEVKHGIGGPEFGQEEGQTKGETERLEEGFMRFTGGFLFAAREYARLRCESKTPVLLWQGFRIPGKAGIRSDPFRAGTVDCVFIGLRET